MALAVLLVEEINVVLGLFLTVYLDDRPFSFFEPAFSDDGFLVHSDFVAGEDFLRVVS